MSTDQRVKVFVRLPSDRAQAFKDAIARHGSTLTQQDVLEQLVENYLAHEAEGSIRHLDGTICPISQLLKGLTDSVEAHWRQLHGGIRSLQHPQPPQ